MTTFAKELDEILHTIQAVDHEEPLIDENGKRWGTQHYNLVDEESVKAAAQSILNLVSERIIGANGKISGYMRPQGYPTYDLTQSYWNDLRKEQRTTLYEGTKKEESSNDTNKSL